MRRIWNPRSPAAMCCDASFLDAAAAIGRRIASDAVWDDGACSWVGAVPDAVDRLDYRALGPALYGGTAGIGLFLARLAMATGDGEIRRTARGALGHAVERARFLAPERRDGLHAGTLGIAWAASEAADVLADEQLHTAARAVVAELSPVAAPPRCPDVVMGAAGALAALLSLATGLGEPDLMEAAIAIGDALIADASVTHRGWSWPSHGRRWPHRLCGVSHGAAGIGWALLELYCVTRAERFRDAAVGAFAYERSWLDATSGTWPDLRIGGRRPVAIQSPMIGTWCHGEAGIALSRIRAAAVLGPGPHADDGTVALEATRRHLAEALDFHIDDLCLCHGAAGAADVLLSAGETHRALAATLGRLAIERHAQTDAWPCGAAGATTPALFRGLAGIGWLFLRLHEPATPSPLALPKGG